MRKLLFTFTLMCISIFMFAQVTTSSIVGKITSTEGEELIGANITAVHMPSGSQYGTASLDGSFRIPNMRVGGPYTVQVSYIGYESQKIEDVFLSLGEKMRLDFQLTSEGISMDEIVVTARSSSVLNGERTGASSTITQEQLSQLPTISRAVSDYTRLNPMAAEGGSFGGRNDQYNNYSVDGSIFNNPFGLDGSTPGSQTSAQPIPLDAIDQIQVSISPYDVSLSGFTGASVNAVTKSGTNDFNGSVYGFFRNQNMTGSKVNGNDAVAGDLSHGQYGVSFSGPIVKNKVFFFANVETERRSDLGSYYVPRENASQAIGGKYSRVLEEDMQKVADLLKAKGWDSGDFSGFNHRADNTKAIFKLDFNLHKNHKLTATYNFLSAYKDKPAHPSAIGRRGPDETTLQFENSGYRINNKIQSGIIELNSMFGTTVSNKIQVGYTKFDDFREPKSTPFPVLNILKDGQRYIIAGHEPFSIHNVLDQSVFQINDQLNYYLGDHTITLGGSFEKFQFDNSFNLTSYGFSIFGGTDINDFEDYVNGTGAFTEYNLDGDIAAAKAADEAQTWALAETNVGQLGLYLQDEWSVNDQFTLTYGLRIDKPLFFDTEEKMKESISRSYGYNPELKFEAEDGTMYDFTHYDSDGNPIQLNSEVFPTAKVQFNPRIGFNYAIKADRSQQLRGGTGLFSGRFPFVWIGNQVANPNADFYCITDPDFEFPQVWRTNIGYDHKFGAGWVASFDAIYTKDKKAAMVKNYGLANPSGKLNGIGDDRPIYLDDDRTHILQPWGVVPANAYVFSNTNVGRSVNISLQVQRSWNNNFVMMAYAYLDAQDAASIDAEISSDAYARNPANIQNTNVPVLAPSIYGNRHRIIGAFSKTFKYANKWETSVSLFTEYAEGTRYSYTYAGDINNDGSGSNDLLYIPTDADFDDMTFSGDATEQAAQRNAMKSWIDQDEYLSSKKGEYAQKYGALTPWFNHWDLKVAQKFNINDGNNVEFIVNVINLGNLFNSNWGTRSFASQTGLDQSVGVSVADGNPVYSFDTSKTKTYQDDFSLLSRWQLQLGLRYSF